jgi:hypothetical protein
MTTTAIHTEVAASFRPDSHGGFISRNDSFPISCPPYVIATIAGNRTEPGTLELPEGYDADTLEQVKAITGWAYRDVYVSARQARELAHIGRQILSLAADKIDPPLGYFEQQSVERLVRLAGDPS